MQPCKNTFRSLHQKGQNALRPCWIAEKLGQKRLWYVSVWSQCFIFASHFHSWAADCVHGVILDAHFWTYGIKYLGMCCSKGGAGTPYDVSLENLHCWSAHLQSQSEGVRTVNTKYTYGKFMCSPAWVILLKVEVSNFDNKKKKKIKKRKLDPFILDWIQQCLIFLYWAQPNNTSHFCATVNPCWHPQVNMSDHSALCCFSFISPPIVVSRRVENSPISAVAVLRMGDTASLTVCFAIKWKVFQQRELIREEEEEEVKDCWGQWEK